MNMGKTVAHNFIVVVIPKEGWLGPACQSFFGYENDEDLKAWFPITQLILGVCLKSVSLIFVVVILNEGLWEGRTKYLLGMTPTIDL